MNRTLYLTSILIFASVTTPGAEAAVNDLPSVIRAASGKEATFVQKFTPRGFRNEQVERGRVVFGTAPQMRWSYETPERKVFVFDGDTSWLYTPSDRQVVVTHLTTDDKRSIPLAFLWDPQASSDLAVAASRKGVETVLTLTPRGSGGQIRNAEVIVGADGMIRSMQWTDRQGNRTEFEFTGYRSARADAGTFRFTPPPGTDIVEN